MIKRSRVAARSKALRTSKKSDAHASLKVEFTPAASKLVRTVADELCEEPGLVASALATLILPDVIRAHTMRKGGACHGSESDLYLVEEIREAKRALKKGADR